MAPTRAQRRLLEIAQGFRIAAVLIAVAEFGIARHLATHPLSTEELARAVGADARAVGRLLRAAAALGMVLETENGWVLTPDAAETLVPESPSSLARYLEAQAAFYRRWGLLTETVRSGHALEASRREEESASWVRRFTLMLYEIARTTSDDIAAALLPILTGRPHPRLLDLGGGHGEFAMALARIHPTLEGTIFDLPPVIEVARELVEQNGLADRIRLRAGDFFQDPLGDSYDLVLVFGVLNGMDEGRAQRLLALVHQALAPGGWVAIRATPPDPSPADRLQHALMDLQMLLATDSGHAPTAEELEGWLRSTGYVDLHWRRTPDASVAVLLGRRH
ncbi:MAG: methyltransferase [Thermomicrobium sp.]|nr:methyltransferase [Thermomicrobium sp.]